jgi:putative tryptophan/tyrosine transport system substrate-binding protein
MRRRHFITIVAGATAWTFAARGQEPRRVIGVLRSTSSANIPGADATFLQGLAETGFVEDRNISIEWRGAGGQYDRLSSLAGQLLAREVAVIVAFDAPSAFAAKAATKTTPIVFLTGADPVKLGLVSSFSRPGSNLTGVSILISGLGPKCLEILLELVPGVGTIALLVNPSNPNVHAYAPETEAAAKALARRLDVLKASSEGELDEAFTTMVRQQANALIVLADPFFHARREQLVGLAARHAIPAIYPLREFPRAGGLMSYGTPAVKLYSQIGTYVGRILKGAKPADLPIQQSTSVELVINLKTAKALGLTVPPSLLARADEVIE